MSNYESNDDKKLYINPWTILNIVYEIIQHFMLTNEPKSMGYTFNQTYTADATTSQIVLGLSYDWKAAIASKRPSIFISRGDAAVSWPTMKSMVGTFAKESIEYKLSLISLPIKVLVVAAPMGFAEQLADYVKQPLMYFSQIIQKDFGLLKFRLVEIGKPQFIVEAKDNFVVELSLQIEYSDNWIVQGDNLKLKTFSATIFDAVYNKPFLNQ